MSHFSPLHRPSFTKTYARTLLQHGYRWAGTEYDNAAANNSLEMIKFLLEVGCPKPDTNIACMNACEDLEVLKYLRENGFSWDGKIDNYDDIDDEDYDEDIILPSRTIVHQAVQYRNLPVLQYILDSGYKLDVTDVSLCTEAVSRKDMRMFKFLLSLGCKSQVGPTI